MGENTMSTTKIDKKHVERRFAEYVSDYDVKDPKIALKVAHTYRVSRLAEEIAKSLKLDAEMTDLCWLIGMLHDIGRFEQCRIYNTFIDSKSIDHAKFGCKLLFEDNLIRDFIETKEYDKRIYDAIYYHNVFRIPTDLTEEQTMLCNVIRDADKIDIIRVNTELPFEEIYDIPRADLENSEITPAVLADFYEEHATRRDLKASPVDYLVGHISLAFELVYPKSRELIRKQGYLDKMMLFSSRNPKTVEEFKKIRKTMTEFLKRNR